MRRDRREGRVIALRGADGPSGSGRDAGKRASATDIGSSLHRSDTYPHATYPQGTRKTHEYRRWVENRPAESRRREAVALPDRQHRETEPRGDHEVDDLRKSDRRPRL